ncbi:hypothetical protein HaLaN_14440 [Haematococcus lacustris]|uniref:Uncharacterized protein n=1 Tax=Haematococcus lacustris TaxID=44745 RepID=A0A699Z865_HAELA|nr:hypothetical protein HaLaN_14440 [Haematococcus lacustris]
MRCSVAMELSAEHATIDLSTRVPESLYQRVPVSRVQWHIPNQTELQCACVPSLPSAGHPIGNIATKRQGCGL